jgi:hypothetical protein
VRRRSGAIVGAVALVAAVGIVGGSAVASTGDGADTQLTKKQFIKVADDACRQGDTLASEAYNEVFPAASVSTTTPAQIDAFAQRLVPILQQEHDSIAALRPPSADKAKVKKLLKTLQRELDALAADPQAALTSPAGPLPKASKLAKKYGFKVCGGG